jgi:uroporphyrinogen decarboxylase
MNSREKFHSVLSFEQCAENMKVEYGYWAGTIRKWLHSGLPALEDVSESLTDGDLIYASAPLSSAYTEKIDRNVSSYFHLDFNALKFPIDMSPMLEKKTIEDNDEFTIFTDNFGITQKVMKKGASVPLFIDYPVKYKNDFFKYIELFDDDYKKRLPKNWDTLKITLRNRDFPIRLGGNPFGFLGFPRHLMDATRYMMSLYDDPKLVKSINEFALNFTMNYWSIILQEIDIDCVFIFEDMSYKMGSLISMEMVEEFLTPYYLKLIDFLKQFEIKHIFVDSDGLVEELIPVWMSNGVTGVFPMEAVNNLEKVREQYPRLQLMGGIDKKILINETKDDIDRELNKVSRLVKHGGYIPHIDHSIPMDAQWDHFSYYRNKLNDILDHH